MMAEKKTEDALEESTGNDEASDSNHELDSDFVERPEWKSKDGRGSQSSEDTYILQGKDAALACHFFEKELTRMARECDCQTIRLPAVGIPDLVTIRCRNPSMTEKFKGLFQDLKSEIQSFSSQEVQFLEDQSETVHKFIAENTSKDVLLYYKPAVLIYSKNSSKMSNTCNSLKVELGIIKPTGRRGRELSTESDGNMSGTENFGGRIVHDSPSGGIYPDLSSVTEYSDTDFDFRLSGNLLVKVYKGSITRVKVDAIVNAANESLHHVGGVARVIEDAAGKELTDESRNYIRRNGDLKVGDVCLTTAGRMPYRSVIHAVGPQWHMYSDKSKCLRDLYATICAVLLMADKEEYGKIAMPTISAGIFGVPKELCADMYVRAAVKYSEDRKTHQSFFREFHIVDADTEILQNIRASWEKWQKDPKAIDPERAADEYAKKHGSFYQSHGQGQGQINRHQCATSPSVMESSDFDVPIFNQEGSLLVPQSKLAKTLHSNDGLQSFEMEGDKQISQSKAVKKAHSMTGLQTDGAKVELKAGELQRGSQSSEDTYILQGKDAALACHFFENELIEMDSDCGCQIVRLPAVGIPDTVTIKCIKPYMKKKFEGLFQKMKSESQSFSSQEVQFSEDQYRTVKKFIKENTNKDVLLYCNPKENQAVAIYSKNSTNVSTVCHKLKVELGIIKPTGRRGRELTLESDGNISGTGNFGGRRVHDSPSGGFYPDISSVTEYSDTDFDFRLSGNLLVKVYKGSITCVKVDAIVNAANESLHHAGGVARVIEDAAGKELTDESSNYIRRHGDLKVGDVCLTTAGRMPYRSVMHVVGPQWHMYSNKSQCLRDLYATICAVLLMADKEEYGKIAMPTISAGIFGVPKELCTDMYVRAAVKYSEDRKTHQTFLREFHIVDVDTEILQDIRASWEKWQKDPKAIDPERAADEYAKKHGSFYQSHGQGQGQINRLQCATLPSVMESSDFDVPIFNQEGNLLVPQSKLAKTLQSSDGLQTAGFEMEGDKQISQSKAVKGVHSMTGLQIDGAKVELKAGELQRGSQSSEDTYILQGKDAVLACHFFENELIEMDSECGCHTVRLPAVGIPDTVTIKCIKPYIKNKFEGFFLKLKSEIQNFSSQEVQFSEDQYRTVRKFIKENTNKDVLLYCNPKENQTVAIYSKNSTNVSNVCHKLKVELGIIKPTERRGRDLYTESDGNMSGIGIFGGRIVHDSPSGGIYPDLSSVTEYSDTDFDFRLGGNLLVKVYKGSITHVKVDAIVNATNESMHYAGSVARVIEDAAGKELTDESSNYIRRHGDLKVGDVCLTTAGRMPYRSVMHVVGPQWHMYSDKSQCLRDLYATTCAVLLKADKEKYGKIAMPAFSVGIFGVPKELCTDMYVRAAVKYSEDRKTHQTFLREFHIVDVDTEILQDVRASWEKWQKDPKAIDPVRAADEYAKKCGSCYQSHGQGRSHRSHCQWTTSSSMESADFDVTLRNETFSAVKVVDIGKENKFGRIIQKFQLGQKLVIKIYKGSLVNTFQLDALVTSINTKGEKGYLGKLVEEAGGTLYTKSFEDKKWKKLPLKPGDIFKCKSGNIHVGCIINVVFDRLQSVMGSELNNYRLILKTFLKNVNDLKDVKTMVMPLLGSGSLRVPSDDLDRCCSGFVQAVLDFCFDWKEPNIKEIHIVSTDKKVCTCVEKAFQSMSV